MDDHPALRLGVASIIALHSLGSIVGEATDGVDAIQKVEELAPDLVIMDVSMPRMGGLDATRQIRRFAAPRLKILILTMHAGEQMMAAALEAGADLAVEKTAPQEQLVKAISKLCEPDSSNEPLAEMIAARQEWMREAKTHTDAVSVFKDTDGNPDGAAGLKMAASRQTAALKQYRAKVYARADNWRRGESERSS